MANYAYLIGDQDSRLCAVVDPAWNVEKILKTTQEEDYKIVAAFATHNHFDHVNGVGELLKSLDIPVYAHRDDASALAAAGKNLRRTEGGETINVGRVEITLLHTPGHTAGSQCLSVGERLVTGDTLFIDGCGRVDLPASNPEQMYQSLRKISRLPGKTVVWPGHNYAQDNSAPLSRQLASNIYLKTSSTSSLEDFLRLVGA